VRTRSPDDPREELGTPERIAYRLERARETLEEARLLAEHGHGHGAINRSYYACFYAVHALLASENLEAHTHEGTRTLFGKHFVKPGVIDADRGAVFTELAAARSESDFGDFVELEADDIEAAPDRAATFVEAVAAQLDVEAA
jgi:uncharacterized protein (UPF0332 family)